MKRAFSLVLPIMLTTAFTAASAYTVSGTVKDNTNKAVAGAEVTLIKENKSTVTDSRGKFTIHEDEVSPGDTISPGDTTTPHAIVASHTPGYISINSGILSFSQSGSSPVQVRIFDLVGNQVFKQTLYGSGQVDLTSGVKARGAYVAQVAVGSAKQAFRFTANGNYSASFSETGHALLKEVQKGETLRVVAEGFDTLTVPLGTLDTTLDVKLKAVVPQFKFGYALGNDPTPSKGCGTNSTLKKLKSVENGDQFQIKVGSDTRNYFITLPKNYDNTKPHKVLFALHCYGSNGEDFVHHAADYDHPTPYYGQQVLDKNGDYIFVSLDAIGGLWNKGQADHDFFAQTLTTLNENYCIDTSRVFITGFSYGAMFSYSLAQDMQDRVRAAATYAVADYNIWLPEGNNMKNLPIAWMNVHGKNDGRCDYNRAKTSALPRILKRNGKADANGDFTDASSEKPEVKWCSWPGSHQWTAHDTGNMSVGWNWESTWVPEEVHKFFEQF